jgi:hypothetical protein
MLLYTYLKCYKKLSYDYAKTKLNMLLTKNVLTVRSLKNNILGNTSWVFKSKIYILWKITCF